MAIYDNLSLQSNDPTWRIATGVVLVSAGLVILGMTPEVRDACARAGRHLKLRQIVGDAIETSAKAISGLLND